MTRWQYDLLTRVAHLPYPLGRFAWTRLVPFPTRQRWAEISTAMSMRSLHTSQSMFDLPAWVPCRRCGGQPCQVDPDLDGAGA